MLRCGARPSLCGGFSCCAAQALGMWASVVTAHRLSSCGAWGELLHSMRNLPKPGIEPVSPVLAGGFLSTVPPGKFNRTFLDLCESPRIEEGTGKNQSKPITKYPQCTRIVLVAMDRLTNPKLSWFFRSEFTCLCIFRVQELTLFSYVSSTHFPCLSKHWLHLQAGPSWLLPNNLQYIL